MSRFLRRLSLKCRHIFVHPRIRGLFVLSSTMVYLNVSLLWPKVTTWDHDSARVRGNCFFITSKNVSSKQTLVLQAYRILLLSIYMYISFHLFLMINKAPDFLNVAATLFCPKLKIKIHVLRTHWGPPPPPTHRAFRTPLFRVCVEESALWCTDLICVACGFRNLPRRCILNIYQIQSWLEILQKKKKSSIIV